MEIWDITVESRPGEVEYQRWRREVLAIRDMAEYRLKRLWRLNFSPADIAADKHWEIYPPPKPARAKPGIAIGEGRGRGVSERSVHLRYAQALLREARGLLQYSRMEPRVLERVRRDEAKFKQIVTELKAKPG